MSLARTVPGARAAPAALPRRIRASAVAKTGRPAASPLASRPVQLGSAGQKRSLAVCAGADKGDAENPDPGLGLKTVWYGAEKFGEMIGGKDASASTPAGGPPASAEMSRQEIIAAIKEDYDVSYFVSGKGDMAAYDPDCVFADPFVSFKGVGRFQKNVGNLGGLMEDINLTISKFEEREGEVETAWKFSCVLDLPWRPKLAAAGGTTHVFGPSGRVVKHIERWDIEPAAVVKDLLKPSSKIPTSRLENFMFSLSAGDVEGMLGAVSPIVIKYSLPIVAVSIAFKAATGEGLPGPLGTLGWAGWVGLGGGAVMEVKKLVGGVGGDVRD